MSTIYRECLYDIYSRVYQETGSPPKHLRASRFFGVGLRQEIQDSGMPLIACGKPSHLRDGQFEFQGMIVTCNLPAEPVTLMATVRESMG